MKVSFGSSLHFATFIRYTHFENINIVLVDTSYGLFRFPLCILCNRYPDLERCSNLLKAVYAIINLFINKNFMIALLVLYFSCLCSSATSDLHFYDVIVFPSLDFALVMGVESFERQ